VNRHAIDLLEIRPMRCACLVRALMPSLMTQDTAELLEKAGVGPVTDVADGRDLKHGALGWPGGCRCGNFAALHGVSDGAL
jgi:hypothetical protein